MADKAPPPLLSLDENGYPVVHLHQFAHNNGTSYMRTGQMAKDLQEVPRRWKYFSYSAYLLCLLSMGLRLATFILAFVVNAQLLGALTACFMFVEPGVAFFVWLQAWGGLWLSLVMICSSAAAKGGYMALLFTVYSASYYYSTASRFITLGLLILNVIIDLSIFINLVNLMTGKVTVVAATAKLRYTVDVINGKERAPAGFAELWTTKAR